MNKRSVQAGCAIIFLLTACATPAATVTPVAMTDPTGTASPIATNTMPPTETLTPSITPLPTIPTFTPTFDVSTIVTFVPSTPVACPEENPAVADLATPGNNGFYEIASAEDVLIYLNSGGTLAQLAKGPPFSGEITDLTGDGLREVVFRGLVRYSILGCKGGKYQDLFELATYDFSLDLEDILDLNKDGISELIFYSFSRYGFASVYIVGWDGNQFRSLINVGTDSYTGAAIDSVITSTYHRLTDTNGDGLKEIVVVYDVNEFCGGLGNPCDGTPARKQTVTLAWNGQNYVVLAEDNDVPQYRFQATQDGDSQTRYGYYAEALSFYQAAIFDDRLEWWSPEREEYERRTYWAQYDPIPTVYPTAILDNTEYPRLAAYAYYRIMLLQLMQNQESDAISTYVTLQQDFGNDQYGQPYAEMATAFWEAYQSAQKMYDGCAAAIQYAAEYPEILIPLGSNYHGWQSHTYTPVDVCPFR